ncbi:MAG: uroporphyrinogen-III C-methyltransferase [Thermoplasmatales archaeon]
MERKKGEHLKISKKIYLVGAGPGNPDYLTVRALKLIKKCDVLLYDRLVDRSIVKLSPASCKRICVGTKHGVEPGSKQDRINELMLQYFKVGKIIIRLKSGDPFIFGRGGEEIEFLKKNNVPFEVVPGLTSAISVPSALGIPLTHRNYSSSLLIISGHRKSTGTENDWNEISRFDGTIVILMGVATASEIVSHLIEGGMDQLMGVAVIENGTTRRERTFFCYLRELPSVIEKHRIRSPSIIVIGKVVNALIDEGILPSRNLSRATGDALIELVEPQVSQEATTRGR